ncbi:MAG: CsbD family protein [Chloroflexi bacterium]|nr:CsbD family protein [Chloroflexota bacterium]
MMQDVLMGNWNQLQPQMKMWWDRLTDDDLEAINGHYDILVSVLMARYAYSAQRAEKQIQQRLGEFEKAHRALVGH